MNTRLIKPMRVKANTSIQSTAGHLHDSPEGCTVGWAGRGGDGTERVCNGERQGGMVGVPGDNQAVWHGSEVA